MTFRRTVYLVAISLFISLFSFSQNLISNGSFENFAANDYPEPDVVGGGLPPIDWIYVSTVDDYLTSQKFYWCCEPANSSAQHGKIFIGLIGYAPDNPNHREYAIGLINKPLVKGHKYYVSLYLQYSHTSAIFLDQFHLFFLNDKVHFPNNIRDGVPDTVNTISIQMKKKYREGWNLIGDTIIANGDEVEIGFGNLIANDKDVKYEKLNTDNIIPRDKFKLGDNNLGYIFLDNVSLIALDSENVREKPIQSESLTVVRLNNIRFNFNDTTFLPQYNDTIRYLTDTLKHTLLKVRLTGFTDSIGNYNYNLKLSQKRANAIRNILLRNGIPTERINIDYKSYLSPVKSNETEYERSMNRRVEILLLKE